MKRLVVGTAGHIDHGKSSLVHALTGTDPDRLDEERRRGITIELGFAELDLGDERRISFVDVPGHERFVRQMVAGASGFDAVLLVVAADQGVQPQTREHLEICRLLEVSRGAVALTKTDLVDEDLAAVVQLELEETIGETFLAGAPIVPVSATQGSGLDALKQVLGKLLDDAPPRQATGLARLPVDRSFVMKGFGTVVTGTLLSGAIDEGSDLAIWPAGTKVRVRGLQVHGRPAPRVEAGSRAAINLQTVSTADVPRGSMLAPVDAFAPTVKARCRLRILEHAQETLGKGGVVRFHQGTAEVGARLGALSGGDLGEWVEADLFFDTPVVLAYGDRFILRRPSPMDTVAGGSIVDTDPPRRKGAREAEAMPTAAPTLQQALEQRIAAAGIAGRGLTALRHWAGRTASEIESCLAETVAGGTLVRTGDLWVQGTDWKEAGDRLVGALGAHHLAHPLELGLPTEAAHVAVAPKMPREGWRALVDEGEQRARWRRVGNRLAVADFEVALDPAQKKVADAISGAYRKAGIAPPELAEVLASITGDDVRSIVELLLAEGQLVRVQGELLMHREVLERLRQDIAERALETPSFGVPQFKEWTGVSRKHAIPLLEYLDAQGMTRRRGNEREWIGS